MSANKPKTKAVKEWNFMDQELDDRKKKILKAIIKTYMETGEPGGFPDHFQVCRFKCKLCHHPE